MYLAIQQNGTDCELITTDGDSQTQHYKNLILYEVDGVQYCYFARGNSPPLMGILANNSEIGLTVNRYYIYNGATVNGTEYVDSSTPSDYYANIKSGNFTLTQR